MLPLPPSSLPPVCVLPAAVSDSCTSLEADDAFWSLFHNERVLGRGSFGTVLLVHKKTADDAAPPPLAAKVAMIAADEPNSSFAHRFREVDILRSLDDHQHPSIVRFHSAFASPSTLFVLMHAELGGTLLSRTEAAGGVLRESEARAHITDIAAALRHLHKHRIVHRDLKASNVLLSQPAASSSSRVRAKLADFGLATQLLPGGRLTSVCGTHDFLAPEMVRCGHGEVSGYDTAVDLWALGLLMHCLLLGTNPFERETEIETLQAILSGDFALRDDCEYMLSPPASSCSSPCSSPPLSRQPSAADKAESHADHGGHDFRQAAAAAAAAATAAAAAAAAAPPAVSDSAASLIRALLDVRPDERATADDCLRHPWIRTSRAARVSKENKGGRGLLQRLLSSRGRYTHVLRSLRVEHSLEQRFALSVH